jgi:3-phosphoshikimate 1-carboxyvinyltransferase
MEGGRSSQYISAVLLVAPYARSPLEVEVTGEFVSRPYVDLTLQTMSDFGVGVNCASERVYRPLRDVAYRAGEYAVEGDASSASYFLAAAAILGGRVAITNLRANSSQGDAAFASLLERMGCRVRRGFLADGRGIEVSRDPGTTLEPISADLNDMPDVALTLAVLALFADGPSHLINIANLRVKETDRIRALATELGKLGADVEEGPDYLDITPPASGRWHSATLDTYDDHRMAMSLALVGLARPGMVLRDPGCVAKSYPDFFTDLDRLR